MMLGFNGPVWLGLGSNGQSFSDLTNHQNTWETNPLRATGAHAVLTDYSGGDRGARLDPRRAQTETARFLGDLEKVYPGARGATTRNAKGAFLVDLEHWPSNPLTKGAYTCNQPGYVTTIADNEQKPVGTLFFAGEHTSSFYEWQGFMEGGVVSGLRAAAEVLRALESQVVSLVVTEEPMDGDVTSLIGRTADANAALVRGDLDGYLARTPHAHDYTLMAPFGGAPTRGFDTSSEYRAAVARFFKSGTFHQEVVATYHSSDLIVLVTIERVHAEIGGLPAQDWSLRVTQVFRREGSEWQLVHRHADPLANGISLAQAATITRGEKR
jgi:ketosteroid isomerase-like protein